MRLPLSDDSTIKTLSIETKDQARIAENSTMTADQLEEEQTRFKTQVKPLETENATIKTLNSTAFDEKQLIENLKGQPEQLEKGEHTNSSQLGGGDEHVLLNRTSTIASLTENATTQSDPENGVNETKSVDQGTRKRRRRKNNREEEKVFSHFLSHIPKSGTSYAMLAINQLVYHMPEWKALRKRTTFRACNEGKRNTISFQSYRYKYKGDKCTMWMSERPDTPEAQHNYVIIRDPKTHVLSQYFHCKESDESKNRGRADDVATLDRWLEKWVSAAGKNKTWTNKCTYNPVEFESEWVKFDSSTPNMGKDDLKQRFDVIGDQAQMDKSVCMITIHYTGWVPKRCNCSDYSSDARIESNSTLSDEERFAHGVKHHGDSFQTTKIQDQAIAKLRAKDYVLYDVAREIFNEQVREVEEKYQFTLCDTYDKKFE